MDSMPVTFRFSVSFPEYDPLVLAEQCTINRRGKKFQKSS